VTAAVSVERSQEQVQPARGRRRVSLWPREHGAYVQLLGPVLCALWVGPINLKAVALAAAACAAFLAHEPLLVLLGRRGQRARSQSAAARWRVALLGAFVLAVAIEFGTNSRLHAVAALVPFLLSAIAALIVVRGRERSLSGQLISATTLASFSIPILVAEAHGLGPALRFAAGWSLVHATATLAARAYVHRRREGASALWRAAALSALALVACAALWWAGLLPVSFALACAPFAAIALLLSTHVLELRSPKTLGWVLTGANLIAFVIFGARLG
jgi:hypothetical protein